MVVTDQKKFHLLFWCTRNCTFLPSYLPNYLLCNRENTFWVAMIMLSVCLIHKLYSHCLKRTLKSIRKLQLMFIVVAWQNPIYLSFLTSYIHAQVLPAFLSNQIIWMHFNHVNLFNATHSNIHNTHTTLSRNICF